MPNHSEDQLTLLLGDSRASHSVRQGSASAMMMTAISGRKCLELYENVAQISSWVKMLLASSQWLSMMSFLTWKDTATPQKRLLFRLVPSIVLNGASGYGFWPTPCKGSDQWGGTLQEAGGSQNKYRGTEWAKKKPHPEWWETLMGYPVGWTELEASEMQSSPKSQSASSGHLPQTKQDPTPNANTELHDIDRR